jgi:hypothetical protein
MRALHAQSVNMRPIMVVLRVSVARPARINRFLRSPRAILVSSVASVPIEVKRNVLRVRRARMPTPRVSPNATDARSHASSHGQVNRSVRTVFVAPTARQKACAIACPVQQANTPT